MRNIVAAPIPEELANRVLDLIARIRAGASGKPVAQEANAIVGEMTEAVMQHFFVVPVAAFGLSGTTRSIIEFGVRNAVKGIRYGLGKIVPHLREPQLRQLADFLDRSLVEAGPRL